MNQFIELHQRFWQTLNNGKRAEIRRVTTREKMETLPAFYRLKGYVEPKEIKQWARVAFFLPFIKEHNEDAESLGQQLYDAKINDKRIFHIYRSTSPNDLIQLRRAIQQAKLSSINWQEFGECLYYWGKYRKKNFIQNYLNQTNEE